MRGKTGLLFIIVLTLLLNPAAISETRKGVIALEGEEETIEETLFDSSLGFSFWYPERLDAHYGTMDGMYGVVIANPYSDDYMVLSTITEAEAAAYTGDYNITIAEQSTESHIQLDVYRTLENGQFHFCSLILQDGHYLRAAGKYSFEAAEGTARFFQRVLDSVTIVNPDAFVGHYSNDSYDEVIIEKQGNVFLMRVSLYRLASLDEGTVSFSGKGVTFYTTDPNGNPLTLSFYPDSTNRYVLRVEETTWTYFEPGMIFGELIKREANP